MALPTWNEMVQPHDVTKAIVGAELVQSINFEDAGEEFASKLTDCDLRHILTCVDAVNKLKRLTLAYCYGIQGHGLEPLRGSQLSRQLT